MSAKYKQTQGLESTELQDETLVLHLETSNFYTLNGTATSIWSLLAEPSTSEEIAAEVATRFEGISPEDALRDVEQVVAELAAYQLIVNV
jgi:hypothetical protein